MKGKSSTTTTTTTTTNTKKRKQHTRNKTHSRAEAATSTTQTKGKNTFVPQANMIDHKIQCDKTDDEKKLEKSFDMIMNKLKFKTKNNEISNPTANLQTSTMEPNDLILPIEPDSMPSWSRLLD